MDFSHIPHFPNCFSADFHQRRPGPIEEKQSKSISLSKQSVSQSVMWTIALFTCRRSLNQTGPGDVTGLDRGDTTALLSPSFSTQIHSGTLCLCCGD